MDVDSRRAAVTRSLRAFPGAVVGFSGGVDSTLLAKLSVEALGARALAVTARSASLADADLREASALARSIGIRHRIVETGEIADPRYARNAPDRCFFCKEELSARLAEVAREEGLGAVLLGYIADDAGDFRPGLEASRKAGAIAPLLAAGLSKAEVRSWARSLGLPNWDRPAEACLASRIAYGETVTPEKLFRVERAEAAVRDLTGLARVRVRVHGDLARIEVDPAAVPAVLPVRERLETRLREAGFLYVTLDLAGYRTGSMNEAIGKGRAASAG